MVIKNKDHSKLKNTETIKKMLDGTHRSQTKTIVSFRDNYDQSKIKRKIGEEWIDEEGKKWQQIGLNTKISIEEDWKRELRESIHMPYSCPSCGKEMESHLDRKFWLLRKKCFDCNVKLETLLRVKGTWEDYEQLKVLQNAISYVKEVQAQLKDQIENPMDNKMVWEDGTIEKWDESLVVKEQCEKALKEMEEFMEKATKQTAELEEKINIKEIEKEIAR